MTAVCDICSVGEESILHVLRDCSVARVIWDKVTPSDKREIKEFSLMRMFRWKDVFHFISVQVRDFMKALILRKVSGKCLPDKEVRHIISWEPPADGWEKLNVDGAVKGAYKHAYVGGLIRNSQGRWCASFASFVGSCSV
ncbi:hypothetical protein GH714_017892 [Hevea brasiliensis]|uniref:Reverse transcriptase zinc-binding domain-containing protein n=1 Tax=Hevea brasiliensis TaxID=3981 RepID=A0A6A6K5D4_HEVBR|nr:hypothetical protein GH714_017892 [Hevea brasiliensis]